MDGARVEPKDPVTAAAKTLMGVDYLFPYQRLVVANVLEAAQAAGIPIEWPRGEAAETAASIDRDSAPRRLFSADDASDYSGELTELREDAADLGRQIVILPTGAGKSLCFQLPALLLPRPTLVIYPILSLMSDQFRRLEERGFAPVLLRGGQSAEERTAFWNRLTSGEARVVIANPEVLLTEAVMARLPSAGFAHLVIDEAHCVSEWGESFRPSYLRIAEILQATGAPLTTAFTATASAEVLQKIRAYIFGDLPSRSIIGNPDRPNIDYAATGTVLRDRAVVDLIRNQEKPAVVFCSSRARTERLARLLRAELPSIDTRFYHAGLAREEKDDVEKWFFSSSSGVLAATCAYGMGVDKSNIRTVVHRDIPSTVEAYLQESGRAGRDGKKAKAFLLWGPEDEYALKAAREGPDRNRFAQLIAYARNADRCRREALMEMLGASCDYCPGCDSCRAEASPKYREYEPLLRFVRRNARRYTIDEAASIIAERGSNGWSPDDAKTALTRLSAEGVLRARRGILWKGKLEPARRPPASS